MANLRLIKIVKLANGTTEFQPATLGVDPSDRIHWNNETDEDHWLEQMPTGFLTNNIRPGDVSNPGFVATMPFIRYRCKLHPHEQGEIAVPAAAMVAVVVPPAAPAVVAVSTPEPQAPPASETEKGG